MVAIPQARPVIGSVLALGQVILGSAAAASAMWGAIELLNGLSGLLQEGSYVQEPFWQTLGLSESPHRTFQWDRAWWLLLIAPLALSGFAMGLGESAEDLKRTARQRARARQLKREHDKAFAASESQARRQRSRRTERKPMSGWKRLWIVLSLLMGAPIFLIQYGEDSSAYVTHWPSDATAALTGQAFWDALYWEAHAKQPSLQGCILSTAELEKDAYGGSYTITCERTFGSAIYPAILYALFPALFLWLVGWTINWVYRGFRPAKA